MKRFFKITGTVLGITFLCLMVVAQIAKTVIRPTVEKELEFERMIERANRDCPIPVAMGNGEVTGIKLENGYVTYYLNYDSGFTNILSKIDDQAKVKEGLLMCFLCLNAQENSQGDLLMDLLVKYGYGLRVVITESATNKFDFKINADEIDSLREKYQLDPHKALYNLLAISIEAERASLPMQIDEGMLLTDYSLDGENIVMTILIDENLYPIDAMASNRNLLKENMFEAGLSDPSSKALFDICKVSHSGLKYIFKGKQSHKTFDILLSSAEIRNNVETPSNVDIQ